VGFLIEFFGIFELTMMVVSGRGDVVKLRLWQVSFPFNFISRSWLSGPVSGLLLFLHNMH